MKTTSRILSAALLSVATFAQAAPPTMVAEGDWELSSQDFFRVINVGNERRFTTFNRKETADVGVAAYRFSADESTSNVNFNLYGGDGEVFLIKDNGSLDVIRTEVATLGRELRKGTYGEVVERARGPRSTSEPTRVSWDLAAFDGQPLALVVIDDLVGQWGFVGVSELTWAQEPGGVEGGEVLEPQSVSRPSVLFELGNQGHLMPGAQGWGRTEGAFFDRRLNPRNIMFISTLHKQQRDAARGALWCEMSTGGHAYDLTVRVKGGHGQVFLIEGEGGFNDLAGLSAIEDQLAGPLADRVLERATGPSQTGPFQTLNWTIPASDTFEVYTVVVLDTSVKPWGFIDVSNLNYQRK